MFQGQGAVRLQMQPPGSLVCHAEHAQAHLRRGTRGHVDDHCEDWSTVDTKDCGWPSRPGKLNTGTMQCRFII
jgi:hypothetical protein